MGTSRSCDENTREADTWTATAFVFSGRPNPTWALDSKVTGEVERIWARLKPSKVAAEPAALLGYTGCAVRDGRGRTWTACDGMVTLREGECEDRRADPDRAFEHAVIASAPPGKLPPQPS